jgi:glycosyl transferase, family 25
MILYNQPKTFVITIKNLETSETQFLDCLASATEFNWKIEKFIATKGTDVSTSTWANEKITPLLYKPTMTNPGVWGCFFSHYRLWKTCVEIQEPIIVLEHDALIKNFWKPLEINESLIKLHTRFKTFRYDEHSGNWSKSAHAYCITPDHSKKLIEFSKKIGAFAVDTMIGSNVVPFAHLNKKETSLIDRQNKTSTTNNLLLYDEKNINNR